MGTDRQMDRQMTGLQTDGQMDKPDGPTKQHVDGWTERQMGGFFRTIRKLHSIQQ